MTNRKDLLEKARELNLKFAKNISTQKLVELIAENSDEMEQEKESSTVEKVKGVKEHKKKKDKGKKDKGKKKEKVEKVQTKPVELSDELRRKLIEAAQILNTSSVEAIAKKSPAQLQDIARRKMLRKKRVIITVYDPQEHKKPGCEISTCNTYSGPIKHFVKYSGEPQHLTISVINILKDRVYTAMVPYKDPTSGVTVEKGVSKPAFGIQELPPLTKEEMDKLAEDQRLAKAAENSPLV